MTIRIGSKVKVAVATGLRQSPGSKDILSLVYPGDILVVLGGPRRVDGLTWWEFDTGWIAETSPVAVMLVEFKTVLYVTATAGLRLRSEASTAGVVFVTMPYRSDVTLLAEAGAWKLVRYLEGGVRYDGWCSAEFLSDVQPPPPLPLPFAGNYSVSQWFGERPYFYRKFSCQGVALKGHNGIDWEMPKNTLILAVDDGVAVDVSRDPNGFGNYVRLKHAWGESLYAHLSAVGVAGNQSVSAGQFVGYSGTHLHFAIRIKPYRRNDGWGGYSPPERYIRPCTEIVTANSTTFTLG